MRKVLSPALVVVLVLGLSLTGCATKKWVNEQVSAYGQVTNTKIHELQDSVEGNQKEISELAANQEALAADVAKLSEATEEAMARADAAGVLAHGQVPLRGHDHRQRRDVRFRQGRSLRRSQGCNSMSSQPS